MKTFAAVLVLLGVVSTNAWVASPKSQRSLISLQLSTAVSPDAYTKPERVVMDDLPTLYVYDHCPFCVRVRLAFGMKNVKHQLYFMANDDIPTPTNLVGKKIAPIFVSSPYSYMKDILEGSFPSAVLLLCADACSHFHVLLFFI